MKAYRLDHLGIQAEVARAMADALRVNLTEVLEASEGGVSVVPSRPLISAPAMRKV